LTQKSQCPQMSQKGRQRFFANEIAEGLQWNDALLRSQYHRQLAVHFFDLTNGVHNEVAHRAAIEQSTVIIARSLKTSQIRPQFFIPAAQFLIHGAQPFYPTLKIPYLFLRINRDGEPATV